MKSFIVFGILFVSLSLGASAYPTKSLNEDLNDFVKFVHPEKLHELTKRYQKEDPEFRAVVGAFDSDVVKKAIDDFRSLPEVQEFHQWLQNQLQQKPSHFEDFDSGITGGWKGFIHDYFQIMNIDGLRDLGREKYVEGGVFTKFVKRYRHLESVFSEYVKSPEAAAAVKELESVGFDLQQLESILKKIYGPN